MLTVTAALGNEAWLVGQPNPIALTGSAAQ